MVGRLTVFILLTIYAGAGLGLAAPAQGAREPYDELSPAQRAVLPGDAARARDDYNRAPAPFREAFSAMTSRLSSLLLSDPENGEVLGSALDLIEHVNAAAVQPTPEPGSLRLAVTLASGARDKLRRSREFARATENGRVVFVDDAAPQVRIELEESPRATIAMTRR